jgi:hypothetical protein
MVRFATLPRKRTDSSSAPASGSTVSRKARRLRRCALLLCRQRRTLNFFALHALEAEACSSNAMADHASDKFVIQTI